MLMKYFVLLTTLSDGSDQRLSIKCLNLGFRSPLYLHLQLGQGALPLLGS